MIYTPLESLLTSMFSKSEFCQTFTFRRRFYEFISHKRKYIVCMVHGNWFYSTSIIIEQAKVKSLKFFLAQLLTNARIVLIKEKLWTTKEITIYF